MPARHTGRSDRQRDRDGYGQPFRDGRNCQGDRDKKHFVQSHALPDEQDRHRDDGGDDPQPQGSREPIQLRDQRRSGFAAAIRLSAIRPISDSSPVATTIPIPRPVKAIVPE